MQELPKAARAISFFAARRWLPLLAALVGLAWGSTALAQGNSPPAFTSTPVTAATENVPYLYSITTSDPNPGDTRTVTAPTKPAWLTFTPGPNGTATLSGTPAQAQVGTHSVVLSVSDGTVAVTQSFNIVVANVDVQPVFTSTPVTTANEDAPYTYSITTSDADGDPLTVTITTRPTWLTFTAGPAGSGTATLSGTPTQAQVGTHAVALRVSDGTGALVQQNFSIVVANTNDPPAFTSTPVTAATEDVAYSYSITTSDPDTGDTRTVSATTKPAWLTFTPSANGTATLSGTPAQAQVGTHPVTLSVTDGTVAVTQSFNIVVANVDDQPVFTSTPVTAATAGVLYTYAITATDADGDPLTITTASLPTWLTLTSGPAGSGTATLSGTPAKTQVGAHNVGLRVSDGTGALVQQNFTITVAPGANEPPAFTSTPVTAATQGVLYSYAITTSDPDIGDTRTVSAPTKPTWLTFTPGANGTATLSGTPAQAQVGTPQAVVLSVSDGTVAATQSFSIVVANVNDPPVFTSTAVTAASQGVLYTYAITTSDPDPGDTRTVTAPTKPAWLTFTPGAAGSGAATLSGTPTQADVGTHAVVLSVTDSATPPGTGSQTFQIVVTNVNDPPAFTSTPVTAATQGAPYSYAITTSDPDNDPRNVTAPTKPAWLTFTPGPAGSGTATLAGIPTAQADVGTHTVVLRVADSATPPIAVTQTFQIVVANVDDQPVFTSLPPTSVNEDASYVYAITATDPDADPLTFAAPTLPDWLTFAPGTPGKAAITSKPGRPSQDDVGAHNVVLSVSDGTPPAVTQSFQITVVSVDDAPVIAPIPPQTATEASPFSLNLATFVTDADTPLGTLTYAATSALPPGLALAPSGLLSGTPTVQLSPGDFNVAFTVRDAGPAPVPGTFPLTVLRAGRADLGVTVAAAPNPVAVNTPATWTFTITNNALQVNVTGFALEATFSGEVPFLFDTPANPGCAVSLSGSETRLACTLGALAGGATTSVALTGRGNAAGDVYVSAKVAIVGGTPIDETPRNDTATGALSVAQSVSASPAQLITGVNVQGAAAGDLNKDGFTDLAIVTPDSTAVLLNIVDPANPKKRALSTAPFVLGSQSPANGIAVVDIDGDGDIDVVTAAGAGVPSRIFVNSNSAFTAMPVGDPSENSRAVAAGDINGDGLIDLVFANGSPNTVYTNQGSVGSYALTGKLGNADSRGVVLVDLFGDALPELVFANADGNAEIYRNAAGAFTLELTLPTGATTSVAAGDFNNDGRADLVFGRSVGSGDRPPSSQVWLNTSVGTGSFFKSAELGASPTVAVTVADIDLDGDLDIFTTNDTGAHHFYANVGTSSGTFALQPQQLNSAGARATVMGKFSVDDRIDAALVGEKGGGIFYNDGKGNLGAGDTAAPTIQIKGVASITLTVEDTYTDAGATATDNMDGDLTAKIVVENTVKTAVIGTYTVTYNVTDSSGNAAVQAERTVRVQAREGTGGGGGGAVGAELVILLVLAIMVRPRRVGAKRC